MRSVWFVFGLIVGAIIFSAIAAIVFLPLQYTYSLSDDSVALIDVKGPISAASSALETSVTPDSIINIINEVELNPKIKGAIFRINSPGGSVVASRLIMLAVKNMKKPSVCLMEDVAASGAYWIASACDVIVSDPLSITGSVGVTASYLEYSGLFEKYGIGYERIVSGESKDSGTPYRNATEDEKGKLQYIVDETFKYFLEDVVVTRGLTDNQVEEIKTGDIFLGKDALELGLVDQLGSLQDAQKIMMDLTGLDKIKLVTLQKEEFSLGDILQRFF